MQSFAVCQIRSGQKVLKGWFGRNIPNSTPLIDVYSEFASASEEWDGSYALPSEYNTVFSTVRVAKAAVGPFIEVAADTDVGTAVQNLGNFIEFNISTQVTEQPQSAASNAFAFMMKAASSTRLLPDPFNETNKKLKLKNSVREFQSVNEVGWSPDSVSTFGIPFINAVGDCLWYVDGHHGTLNSQSCGVPEELAHIQGYNCPEQHGHKRKSATGLSREELQAHVNTLYNLLDSCGVQFLM